MDGMNQANPNAVVVLQGADYTIGSVQKQQDDCFFHVTFLPLVPGKPAPTLVCTLGMPDGVSVESNEKKVILPTHLNVEGMRLRSATKT